MCVLCAVYVYCTRWMLYARMLLQNKTKTTYNRLGYTLFSTFSCVILASEELAYAHTHGHMCVWVRVCGRSAVVRKRTIHKYNCMTRRMSLSMLLNICITLARFVNLTWFAALFTEHNFRFISVVLALRWRRRRRHHHRHHTAREYGYECVCVWIGRCV